MGQGDTAPLASFVLAASVVRPSRLRAGLLARRRRHHTPDRRAPHAQPAAVSVSQNQTITKAPKPLLRGNEPLRNGDIDCSPSASSFGGAGMEAIFCSSRPEFGKGGAEASLCGCGGVASRVRRSAPPAPSVALIGWCACASNHSRALGGAAAVIGGRGFRARAVWVMLIRVRSTALSRLSGRDCNRRADRRPPYPGKLPPAVAAVVVVVILILSIGKSDPPATSRACRR